ncbi:hypothetical protein B0O99DRAFT_579875 [Bisporella sp. PMI_857]|nr:hypothetical protein B0O99DRAFT_579875 [Bisporella sp. PMI_857]
MQDISDAEWDKFTRSCVEAARYPTNLVYHDTYDHISEGYSERLDEQENRIFVDEAKASLTLRDYDEAVKRFKNITICSNLDLQGYLMGRMLLGRLDPQCRFVFIHAPHSRERLKTTREMLTFALTYHQVIPTFLDFLFPFGKQQYTQDFQFSGFQSEDRLSEDERGLELRQLGRSGRELRVCYNLKSVEVSKGQKEWPWSIRQTAAYHSFDVETGKALWFIIKGDQLMEKRMEAATQAESSIGLKSLSSLAESFSATLQTHLVVFDWCRDHWRWYLNFLEQELHKLTREALLVDLDRHSDRNNTNHSLVVVERTRSSRLSSPPKSASEKAAGSPHRQIKQPPSYPYLQRIPSPEAGAASSFSESQDSLNTDEDFSFGDLQNVQSLEEKANETILVLDTNISTLSQAKLYYREVVISAEFPRDLQTACVRGLAKFERKIGSIIVDLKLQQARTKMLLRLLTDRKNLVSSDPVKALTQDMHEIARKTKQETVSMRIITLVTLFFLPGTFISVSIKFLVRCKVAKIRTDPYEHGYSSVRSGRRWRVT